MFLPPLLLQSAATVTALTAVRVPGAEALDWEDIALGPCPRGLVAIRTYAEVYLFSPGPGGLLAPADRPVCSIAELDRPGEGISFRDDSSLVLTSEANPLGPGTIHTVRCPR